MAGPKSATRRLADELRAEWFAVYVETAESDRLSEDNRQRIFRDLALAVALHEVMGLRARPDARAQQALSDRWAPFRSVAARLLWHYYLNTRRPRPNQE